MDQVTGISADRGREAVEDRLNYELDLLKKYAENGRIIIEFDNSVGVGTDYGEDYAKYLELTTDEGKILFFKWWGIKGNVVYESAYDWSTELEEWESPVEEMIVDYIMEAGGAEIEFTDEEDTLSGLFQLSDSGKIENKYKWPGRIEPFADPRDVEVDESNPDRIEWKKQLKWEIVSTDPTIDSELEQEVDLVDELTGVDAYRLDDEDYLSILKAYNLVDNDLTVDNIVVKRFPIYEEIYVFDKTTGIEYTIGELY